MRKATLLLLTVVLVLSACPSASSAKITIPFQGHIDLAQKEYSLVFDLEERGLIRTRIIESAKDKFEIVANIDHLETPFFQISTELMAVIERPREGESLIGKVWSKNSLVQYKPIMESSGNIEIKGAKLLLSPLSMGKVTCRGVIGLNAPHYVDLQFDLKSIAMPDFLGFWDREINFESAGPVSGTIDVSGPPDQLALKGQLSSEKGFVKNLEFDSISLKFDGVYPVIHIMDSKVSKMDGLIFSIDGDINLAERKKIKEQIQALTKSPLVEIKDGDVEWTLKSVKGEDNSTTKLKYRRAKEEGIVQTEPKESDVLGVQRTIEF